MLFKSEPFLQHTRCSITLVPVVGVQLLTKHWICNTGVLFIQLLFMSWLWAHGYKCLCLCLLSGAHDDIIVSWLISYNMNHMDCGNLIYKVSGHLTVNWRCRHMETEDLNYTAVRGSSLLWAKTLCCWQIKGLLGDHYRKEYRIKIVCLLSAGTIYQWRWQGKLRFYECFHSVQDRQTSLTK